MAFDMGFECVQVASFKMGDAEYLLDGETNDGFTFLLRRPVVLISIDYLRNECRKPGDLGDRLFDRPFTDCKRLRSSIPKGEYHLFDADMEFNTSREADPTCLAEERNVIGQQRSLYGEHLRKDSNEPLTSELLTTFCPVTWKSLELFFAHAYWTGLKD